MIQPTKKLLISMISLIFISLFFSSYALAQTPAGTSSAKTKPIETQIPDTIINQINNLKERVASQVAKLKLVEKRGIVGTVQETTATQIIIVDLAGNTVKVDVDEITKFTAVSNDNFGISDLVKGTKISVLGLYNKESKRILARFIDSYVIPQYITGEISSIDNKNYQFKVLEENGKTANIDVENITKTYTFTKANDLIRTGFSKLTVGDRVSIMGYTDKKDSTLIISSRTVRFPELPQDPKIVIPGLELSTTPTASPTATLKTKQKTTGQ